jgi:prevent-host-death family protein
MRIASGDLIRQFGKYSDAALHEPIIITRKGRDRLVLLSVDEYNFLREALQEVDEKSQS